MSYVVRATYVRTRCVRILTVHLQSIYQLLTEYLRFFLRVYFRVVLRGASNPNSVRDVRSAPLTGDLGVLWGKKRAGETCPRDLRLHQDCSPRGDGARVAAGHRSPLASRESVEPIATRCVNFQLADHRVYHQVRTHTGRVFAVWSDIGNVLGGYP